MLKLIIMQQLACAFRLYLDEILETLNCDVIVLVERQTSWPRRGREGFPLLLGMDHCLKIERGCVVAQSTEIASGTTVFISSSEFMSLSYHD